MSSAARDLERIEELEDEVEKHVRKYDAACRRIKELETGYEQSIADLNVIARFWRQAAEHAVTGWNALEDKVDAAIGELQPAYDEAWPEDAAHGAIAAALTHLVDASPEEPPTMEQLATSKELPSIVCGDQTLRVIEEETPIPGVGIVRDK